MYPVDNIYWEAAEKYHCAIMKSLIFALSLILTGMGVAHSQKTESFRGKVNNGYNFWIYTPKGYSPDSIRPLFIFLHGRSLCGRDLNRVKRYGTLHTIDKGLDVDGIVLAPHNPGGAWNPQKIMNTLKWVEQNFSVDTNRVYVLGISLGSYGALDFTGTFPDKVAATVSLCGGSTLTDFTGLAQVPIWFFHGTNDKAVPISASQKVIDGIKAIGDTCRHLFTPLKGHNHNTPAKILYMKETYQWLLEHSLQHKGRPVNKEYTISSNEIANAYRSLSR